MKRLIMISMILCVFSISAYAQTGMMESRQGQMGQGMMMGEGKQQAMCPMMGQDMMQMMMDMMNMQEKMMKGPKAAEKKQMMKDMAQMKEKMQKMMSMPMDMKCMDDSQSKEDAGNGPKNAEPSKTDPHKH